MSARTLVLTMAALVCFAANSLLCRAALRPGLVDAATFTAVRLAAGAAALGLLVLWRREPLAGRGGWGGAAALFGYAILFSWAYLRLTAGVGALLLFGAVQVTLFVGALVAGQHPRPGDLVGLVLAGAGLVLLTAPTLATPESAGALAMLAAGVAWGLYTLRARGETRPLLANAGNFLRTLPAAAAALAIAPVLLATPLHATPAGLLLALVSGALTSGLGYAIWYAALPGLTPVRAGLVQLAVPVLAALGGVALLGERLTARLLAAAALVLGGIALALWTRQHRGARSDRGLRTGR